MASFSKILVMGSFLVATAALAHQGVKNPAVKARMDAMRTIGDNTKVLGAMAKGERGFDVDAAREAAMIIAARAAEIPDLFRAQEEDPKSEAMPVIWENFSEFSSRAKAMQDAANSASQTILGPDDVRPALAAIGKTCKSCHNIYRE